MIWYLLWAKAKMEFEVAKEIEAITGQEVLCPRKLLRKRVGRTKRDVVFFDAPYLSNFLFARISDDSYIDVMRIKGLAKTNHIVNRRDMIGVQSFADRIEAEYQFDEREKHNLEAISEYHEGQKLEVLGDRFGEIELTFKGMVDRNHDPFPKVQMVGEMMGREVTVEADPLEVRAAE